MTATNTYILKETFRCGEEISEEIANMKVKDAIKMEKKGDEFKVKRGGLYYFFWTGAVALTDTDYRCQIDTTRFEEWNYYYTREHADSVRALRVFETSMDRKYFPLDLAAPTFNGYDEAGDYTQFSKNETTQYKDLLSNELKLRIAAYEAHKNNA